jgi:hypothetical protein
MVYTLIERHIRKKLKEEGKVIKGNKGKTNNPTGEVLFWNLSGISVISYLRIGKYKHTLLSCARILCRKSDILGFHSSMCASKQKPRNQ